jgi:Protein of unknown function (DUF3179)
MGRSLRAFACLASCAGLAVALGLGAAAGCRRSDAPAASKATLAAPERPLGPLEVANVYAVLESGSERLPEALDDLVARGDHRFVAVLIEALRASQIGLLGGRHYNAKVVALERLSGQRFGGDWFAWVRWYAGTELAPPPGFDAFKGRLLAKADPALGDFFEAPAQRAAPEPAAPAEVAGPGRRAVRSEEILWAGAPVDRSSPASAPAHQPAAASAIDPGEPVVGVALGGETRAYPLRWLDWHEVANDRLGGQPIAVVWCGFCASVMAFAADAPQGAARTFAASGLVQRSVRLMYDHQTKSLWNELTGRPALGAGAAAGTRLEPLPALLTTWGAWRERNPETTVLDLGAAEQAPAASPYGRYHGSGETVFPVALSRTELGPKARVYALELGPGSRAWPLDALLAAGVVNDDVAGRPVALVATRGAIELEGLQRDGSVAAFSPGAEVRAYDPGPARRLQPGPGPDELLDERGRTWRATDAALVGPDGERAPRLPGTVAYWFAWQAFHPETSLYEAD